MKTVELHPAHCWTCDECGRDNFRVGFAAEPSPEERAEFEEATGQAFVMDEWTTAPDEVTCAHCGETFRTEHR